MKKQASNHVNRKLSESDGAPAEQLKIAQRYQSSLKELFNVSQVELVAMTGTEARAITTDADGSKCTRCWNYRTDIGADPRWSTVCGRCAGALDEIGFPPLSEEVPV